MEKQEFNLSEKWRNTPIEADWDSEGNPLRFVHKPYYSEEDVKEFIRLLKKNPMLCFNSIMEEEINKLAGKELGDKQ